MVVANSMVVLNNVTPIQYGFNTMLHLHVSSSAPHELKCHFARV